MKGLQAKLAGTKVQLVSISVDPDRDTPEVLDDYARKFAADPDRWWFLTGPKDDLVRLIRERFKLGLSVATEGRNREGGGNHAQRPPGARRSRQPDRRLFRLHRPGEDRGSGRRSRAPRPPRGCVGPPPAAGQREPQRHLHAPPPPGLVADPRGKRAGTCDGDGAGRRHLGRVSRLLPGVSLSSRKHALPGRRAGPVGLLRRSCYRTRSWRRSASCRFWC